MNIKRVLTAFLMAAVFITAVMNPAQVHADSTSAVKTLVSITAASGGAAYYGDEPKASVLKKLVSDVRITAVYSDGSTATVVNKEDYFSNIPGTLKFSENDITVSYSENGVTAPQVILKITGVNAPVVSITAEYTGTSVIQNKPIPKSGFNVTAVDMIGAKHVITDFTIEPQIATTVSQTAVIVSSGNITSKPVYVPTDPVTVTKLTATYTGTVIEKGQNISKDHILVNATFSDGTARNLTPEEFDLPTTLVSTVGTNTFAVYYRPSSTSPTYQAKFNVKGIAPVVASTLANIMTTVKRGKYSTDAYFVTLGKYIRQDFAPKITAPTKSYDKKQILQAVKRVNKTSKYIGMKINLDGYQFDRNNTAKVLFSVPADFNIANTALYYTPDMKKKMGQVPEYIYKDEKTGCYYLRTFIYRSGWYVLMEKEQANVTENTLRDDDIPKLPILVAFNAPTVMYVKDIAHPKATLLYSNEKLEYTYKSTAPSVLLIEDSASGKMKALKKGKSNVTVTSNDGRYVYTYTVTVKKAKKTTTTTTTNSTTK